MELPVKEVKEEVLKPVKTSKLKNITWGPVEAVVVTVFIFFAAQIIGAVLASLYPLFRGWTGGQTTTWLTHSVVGQFVLLTSVEAVILILLYAFLRYKKATFWDLGLVRPRLKDAGIALMAAVVYFVLLGVGITLLHSLLPSVDVNQKQQLGFETATQAWQLTLVFLTLVIWPPFVEEIVCRGFLYLGLKTKLPIIWAAIVTSIVFALPHLQFGSNAPLLWAAAVDTFILSGVSIYIREKTNTLWPSIGLHMIKNGIAFYALFVIGTALR